MVAGSGDGVQWLRQLGLGSESSGGGGNNDVAVQGRARWRRRREQGRRCKARLVAAAVKAAQVARSRELRWLGREEKKMK